MKKTNLVLATILTGVMGFGSGAAMAESHGDGERSWKHHSGKQHGGKHGKRGGRHGGGKHMMKRMTRKLGLTDDQKAQMKTMRQSQRADNQVMREQMKQLRQDMRTLNPNDATAVANIAVRKGELTQQMFIARNKARVAFESILTAEQKTKLAEMKAKRQARMQERMEKRKARKEARAAKNAS